MQLSRGCSNAFPERAIDAGVLVVGCNEASNHILHTAFPDGVILGGLAFPFTEVNSWADRHPHSQSAFIRAASSAPVSGECSSSCAGLLVQDCGVMLACHQNRLPNISEGFVNAFVRARIAGVEKHLPSTRLPKCVWKYTRTSRCIEMSSLEMVDAGRFPTVVIPFSIPIAPETCSVTARIIFETIRPQFILCVADLPAPAYSGRHDEVTGCGPFGLVSTRAARLALGNQASTPVKKPFLPLPPGDMVVGLAAALITCAHVCHPSHPAISHAFPRHSYRSCLMLSFNLSCGC